jgi:hypothetical protein
LKPFWSVLHIWMLVELLRHNHFWISFTGSCKIRVLEL